MSFRGRGSSGLPSGACMYTATPPSARMVKLRAVAASISRRASATGSASGTSGTATAGCFGGGSSSRLTRGPVTASSRGEEEVKVAPVLGDVDNGAAQEVRRVVAAGVQTEGRADLLCGARLVDMPVEAHHRLVALDRFPHRLASDGNEAGPATADDRLERLVELRRDVEPAAVGRAVEVHDRTASVRHGVEHLADPSLELVLVVLALGLPRGRGHVAEAGQHRRPQVAQTPLRTLDA